MSVSKQVCDMMFPLKSCHALLFHLPYFPFSFTVLHNKLNSVHLSQD